MTRPKPVVLAILDGWGHSESDANNAIAAANTPNMDDLKTRFPDGLINASEGHVGLPGGQMGNSEVGHMNIGSGRVVMQEFPRINTAIEEGSLAENAVLQALIVKAQSTNKCCHLVGMISPGGVHSHQDHVVALAKILAGKGLAVHIHAILDGRDTPPKSAVEYIGYLDTAIADVAGARTATVSGRYYAMDRDQRWDRVEQAYSAITKAQGERFDTAINAIEASYAHDITDEFVVPCMIGDYAGVQDNDVMLFANFRADRMRELPSALLDPRFDAFARAETHLAMAAGMVEYSAALSQHMQTLFLPQPLTKIFGEVIAEQGLTQLRIAETEKYAHVTFFFNGGNEALFKGEERILIPSPDVATYDQKPEMSAYEVTDALLETIEKGKTDVIIVNYANTDMVGHTGDTEAAKKAVEAVDACVGKIAAAVLARDGAMIVTADHGNAEKMFDDTTDQAHTAHTLNLVPVIIAQNALEGKEIGIKEGKLADIAPTLLALLQLDTPAEMTGESLLK